MNKFAIMVAAAATVATFGVAGAYAMAGGDFAKADANKDTFVSMDEAMAMFPTLTTDQFTKADSNGDSKLDEAEFGSLAGLPNGDNTQASSQADSSAMAAPAPTSSGASNPSASSGQNP